MPLHFTYKIPEGNLQQGDLIYFTDDLKKILLKFHPYYANHKDYKFLIVLTQSCDLELRKGKGCKSRYITIAPVRPIEIALQRRLAGFQKKRIEKNANLCAVESREHIMNFVRTLLNNNQSEYFYLEPDPELGLHTQMVAFLSLSVALKSSEHYEKCLKARIGQLKSVFQAKLGWLVGAMFSRVGTPDWTPEFISEKQFEEKVGKIVDNLCNWQDKDVIQFLNKKEKVLQIKHGEDFTMSKDHISKAITEFHENRKSGRAEFSEIILDYVREILAPADQSALKTLENRLKNAPDLNPFLKFK